MVEKQLIPIVFKCLNCKHENEYYKEVLIGITSEGSNTQIFKCVKCDADNKITIQGYRFPPTTSITRGN